MPKVRRTTVYQFDELSERAKERAREWYRNGALDYDWWGQVYEQAGEAADLLGLDICQKPVKLMSGKTRMDPSIWFSGFYCQGSGSAYDGTWYARDLASEKLKAEWPKDTALHTIADALRKVKDTFPRAFAYVKSCRDTSIDVEVTLYEADAYDEEEEKEPTQEVYSEHEEMVIEALRDFNHWIFRSLEQEYEYLNSDEQVDESIRANEYEFTEEGERF